MGTKEYTEAQAKKSGDLILYVGQDKYKVPGVVTTEGRMNLTQRGY
jgi:hypothetical protein